jgi:hypothetical protein
VLKEAGQEEGEQNAPPPLHVHLQEAFHSFVDEQRNKKLLLPYLPEQQHKEVAGGRVADALLDDVFRYQRILFLFFWA